MELLQLRYFHEVAQTQHMTNSAKRLGVAQPALTQAIRRLFFACLFVSLGIMALQFTGADHNFY